MRQVEEPLGYNCAEYADRADWRAKGHQVDREFSVGVQYKSESLGLLRLDMVVDKTLVIEIKASDNLHKDAQRQLLGYLRATGLEVGLLLHFAPSSARFYRLVNSNDRDQSAKFAKFAQL